ncbi:uncharacterized protein LOC130760495 isoform X5 [Actinidia eriantha]|uniref:uncharacterized protein LOC130760495 isoform X5 n=1 Tax=Actinidia eriantha TaxID=165200 RepID=UPI00258AF839|nr:uncharacterized protein LOC130760495 isoform X5 [Actinidia eriantha]
MEESADWRLRYDEAVERASKCTKELIEIKKSLKKVEDAAGINKKLEMLQKENMGLLVRVKSLKQEIEAEKSKCNAL